MYKIYDMTRPLRVRYERAIYHVYSRGNRKEFIFPDEKAIRFFLGKLDAGAERYAVEVHAYCVMGNHYHLLITTCKPNISDFMHFLQSSFASYLAHRGWVGHVFAGRYDAQCVKERQYLQALTRYIHLNPVKAGLASHPEDYPWSSYRAYVSPDIERLPPRLETSMLLGQFAHDQATARRQFEAFVLEGLQQEGSFPKENVVARAILGSQDFVDEIRALLASDIPHDATGKKRLRKAQELLEVYQATLGAYGIEDLEVDPMHIVEHRKTVRKARRAFIFLAKEHTIATNREIARMLGDIGETAVSQHYGKMKKSEENDDLLLRGLDEIFKKRGAE
jgi:REP element-mobilizing transposase RayT